jgi:hypothetical protein
MLRMALDMANRTTMDAAVPETVRAGRWTVAAWAPALRTVWCSGGWRTLGGLRANGPSRCFIN